MKGKMNELTDQLDKAIIISQWVDLLADDLADWVEDLPEDLSPETKLVLHRIPERVLLLSEKTTELRVRIKTLRGTADREGR